MPVMTCTKNGRKGHKYGQSGKCYTGSDSKSRAAAQGRAIQYSKHHADSAMENVNTQIKYRRAQLLKKPRVKKLPVWQYPSLVEKMYATELIKYVDMMSDVIESKIISHIQSLLDERRMELPHDSRMDDWAENASRLMETAKMGFNTLGYNPEPSVKYIGSRTNAWNDTQWRRMIKSSLGVDVFAKEPWLNSELNSFMNENTSLITKMKDDTLNDISVMLQRSTKEGDSYGTITEKIRKRVDVSKSRARLIARDQVGKLNGQLTELRQTNIGIKKYTWRTAEDERVRPSHRANNGKKFEWDNAPSTGHPGQAIQCRCYAEPDFTPVFEEHGVEFTPESVTPTEKEPTTERERMLRQLSQAPSGLGRDIMRAMLIADKIHVHSISLDRKLIGAIGYTRRQSSILVRNIGSTVRDKASIYARLLRRPLARARTMGLDLKLQGMSHLNTFYNKLELKRVGDIFIARNKDLSRLSKMLKTLTPEKKSRGMTFHQFNPSQRQHYIGGKYQTVHEPKLIPESTEAELRAQQEILKSGIMPIKTEKSIQNYEAILRLKKKKEVGYLVESSDGRLLKSWVGTKQSIHIDDDDLKQFKNKVFMHNHLNNASFSPGDISTVISNNLLQARVVTSKYKYVMTKERGADDWFKKIPDVYKTTTAQGDQKILKDKFFQYWLDIHKKEHAKLNRYWLLKNAGKGVYPSKKEIQSWIADSTHEVNKKIAREFGFVYSRTELVQLERRMTKIKKLSVEETRRWARQFLYMCQSDPEKVLFLKALDSYTSGFSSRMNQYLAGRLDLSKLSDKSMDEIKSRIFLLDQLFKMPGYPKFVGTSWRGVPIHTMRDMKEFMGKMRKGATVQFPEFVSSSRSRLIVEDDFLKYSEMNEDVYPIMLIIKGRRGLFVDNVLGSIKSEEEILFNRNTNFKVREVKFSVERGIYEINIEEI